MRRASLDALRHSLTPHDDGRATLPPPDEMDRRLREDLPRIAARGAEAFGPGDPRAGVEHLATLDYGGLLDVCRDSLDAVVKRNAQGPKLAWFRALPLAEQVRLCLEKVRASV